MIRYAPAGVVYIAAPFLAATTRAVTPWGPALVGVLVLLVTAWALLDR